VWGGLGPTFDPSDWAARLGRVTALPGLLTALGGACELTGLVLVIKEIADDRRQAKRLFVPRRVPAKPRRRYPGKALPRSGATSPFESMQTAARQQQALRAATSQIEAAMINAFIAMRKSLDTQHDTTVDQLHEEIRNFDNELREHLRYVLAGSIRNRLIGAVLLGVGILLEIAGALVAAL
jgi:hypothetical protein